MKSKISTKKRRKGGRTREPRGQADEVARDETEPAELDPDSDDDDPHETELQRTDDRLWDVFILDDDVEPLPDYGDFWFPD
jgi:hypothetical protein